MGKTPFFFPSPVTKTGEGERAASAALAGGPRGFGGGRGEEKRVREVRRPDSRSLLGRRRIEAA